LPCAEALLRYIRAAYARRRSAAAGSASAVYASGCAAFDASYALRRRARTQRTRSMQRRYAEVRAVPRESTRSPCRLRYLPRMMQQRATPICAVPSVVRAKRQRAICRSAFAAAPADAPLPMSAQRLYGVMLSSHARWLIVGATMAPHALKRASLCHVATPARCRAAPVFRRF